MAGDLDNPTPDLQNCKADG